jgi:CubicO group peptidase (beta-lactamase class C family)
VSHRILLFALLIAAGLQGQSSKSRQTEVDRIFAAFNTHTPGCAVGVSHQGKTSLTAGYGMADLERNVPITPDTVFESGSVAKQFTATALLVLAQQGKISLDDPMRKYLPELPDYGTPLTIRHVISHISGLREWRLVASFSGQAEGTRVLSNSDLLQIASRQRALNFDPGTAYSYTNTGFNIATILVERALGNGKTFQDFTREQIFEPLLMTHTRWRDDFRAVVPNRALAYTRSPGGSWIQDTPIENIIGAGGMLSTVGDWLLWNENFTHARVGGRELVKALQTPAMLTSGKTIAYAAGLTNNTVDGLREVSHGGSTGGYRTWLGRYPDQAVSVAVMCNAANANPVELGRQTARLWTGGVAASPTSIQVDAAKLRELTGMYRKLRDNTVVELGMNEGKLTIDGHVELAPQSDGKFSAGERQLVFDRPGAFRDVTPNGDTLYERVEPAFPSDRELAALAGQYESAETRTTLTITAKGRDITLAVASNQSLRLRPTFRDAFMIDNRDGTSIHFLRDSAGNVTGLSAGDDRVWDLRFRRISPRP